MRNFFTDILPSQAISDLPNDLTWYGEDAGAEIHGKASVVLFPSSTLEVQAIVRRAIERKIPLIPSGGRTGYSGGATATKGEVVVSLEKMNQVYSVQPTNRTLRCQAGVTLEKIHSLAREHGLFYPIDIGSKGSAHIGGTIATNAGGMRVFRYGLTKNFVMALTVVTGTGEILTLGSPLIKNQAGLDLRALFIGSEGCLGIITECTLLLSPPPGALTTAFVALPSAEASLVLLKQLHQTGKLALYEYLDERCIEIMHTHNKARRPFVPPYQHYILFQLEEITPVQVEEIITSAIGDGTVVDCVVAQNETQAKELLACREGVADLINKSYPPHKHDIAVAPADIAVFISQLKNIIRAKLAGRTVFIFGHIADGNLHLNTPLLGATEEERCTDGQLINSVIDPLVLQLGGTLSAEHGVGRLKAKNLTLLRSTEEILLMRSIKTLLDPFSIMNPGSVII